MAQAPNAPLTGQGPPPDWMSKQGQTMSHMVEFGPSIVSTSPVVVSAAQLMGINLDDHPDCLYKPLLTAVGDPFPKAINQNPSSHDSPASHQNIDWRNYKTYREYIDHKRLYLYGSRTIQERLDRWKAASKTQVECKHLTHSAAEGAGVFQAHRRRTTHDRTDPSLSAMPPRSASQDGFSSIQKLVPKYRVRSCDYLELGERLSLGKPSDRWCKGRVEEDRHGEHREHARSSHYTVPQAHTAFPSGDKQRGPSSDSQNEPRPCAATRDCAEKAWEPGEDAGLGHESVSMLNSICWFPNHGQWEVNMRHVGEQKGPFGSRSLDDSLNTIPFIDEPFKPNVDHEATHIPASAVISVTSVTPTVAPSPTFPCQLLHDQESLVESQSKAEPSRSHDEGLDYYKEAGRPRSSFKPIPNLTGVKKAVTGRKSSEDFSSDVFNVSSKEGWLYFRQFNTERIKVVGVGIRPWKLMFAVLRGHTLYLYKDKKERRAYVSSQCEDGQQPISIKACLIDISYSDTKRKNVLRLTTSACQYLLQAESREDMLSWIRVLQENSSLDEESGGVTSRDLISRKIKEYNTMMSSSPNSKTEVSPKASQKSLSIRQTFLGGKVENKAIGPHSPKKDREQRAARRDDASPLKEKATWGMGFPSLMRKKTHQGVTFGVRLDDCPPAQSNRLVPLIVEVCCRLVEERGLDYIGIYRVPGNKTTISSLQEDVDKGMNINVQDDKWRDLNVISSLLKSFFRKLPEPLFTNEKYAGFIEANRTEDSVERLKLLKRLLHQLPEHHYETLKFLSEHLKTVAENCEKNKMEPRNLAIVFGPTLVRTSEDNMTHMVTHMPDQYKIVETLIQHYDWFFTEEGEAEPVLKSKADSESVPNIAHLLPYIGWTTGSGDKSDSATSDSAKSKAFQGSGKEQNSKDQLHSSVSEAASRKRKKGKGKPQPTSSDNDLDGVFLRKGFPNQSCDASQPQDGIAKTQAENVTGMHKLGEGVKDNEIENGNKSFELLTMSKKDQKTGVSPTPSPSPSSRLVCCHGQTPSLSDPLSHCESGSEPNSTSSQVSRQKTPQRKWIIPDIQPGCEATEVCSITSGYSTASSMNFLTATDSRLLSPEEGESRGEEADDEHSEGRPTETDSESDYLVFASTSTLSRRVSSETEDATPKPEASKVIEHEEGHGNRESQVLGRAVVRSECEKQEMSWRLKITERLKFRMRSSADDIFAVGTQRSRSLGTWKKKTVRRRHTMGGQQDLAELAGISDRKGWGAEGQGLKISAMDHLKLNCGSQNVSIREWITQEGSVATEVPLTQSPQQPTNRDSPQKITTTTSLVGEVHPHKLSGSHVVCSRFYQYL